MTVYLGIFQFEESQSIIYQKQTQWPWFIAISFGGL